MERYETSIVSTKREVKHLVNGNEPVLIALQLVHQTRRALNLVVNARARTLACLVDALTRGGDARLAVGAIAHVRKGRTMHGGRVGTVIVGVQAALCSKENAVKIQCQYMNRIGVAHDCKYTHTSQKRHSGASAQARHSLHVKP